MPTSYEKTVTQRRSKEVSATKEPRRRYVLNRRLLFVTLAILTVVLPASYFWYKHQRRQTASALLARAEQLEQDADWADATSYYQRYLQMEPDDTKALLQLVQVVSKGPRTDERLRRFNNLLYRSIGRAPERNDLRRMLAENLLELGAFEEAEKEADWLLEKAPEEARAARKIKALSLAARAGLDQGITISQAAEALRKAAEESPGDAQLVEVAAETLRKQSKQIDNADTNIASIADQLMDKLVAADPKNVSARLTRYRYRVRNKLVDDAGDLQAALELEPDNVDAILLSALATGGNSQAGAAQPDAKTLLHRAIDKAPRDPRAYLLLADLLEQSGQQDDALALLQRARKPTDDNFDVRVKLARAQINANKIGAAEQTLQELEADTPGHLVHLARLDGEARPKVENQLRLLRARIDLGKDNIPSAVSRLNAILLTMESKPERIQSREWSETLQLLAQIHARAGQWDKASEYWGALSKARPDDSAVARIAVDAHLKNGNAQAAVDTIDEFSRLKEPTADLLVQFVQAHLALQLSRPPADHSWSEFERALDSAKAAAANRPELVFAEATYLVAKSGDRRAAVDLVQASEEKFNADVAFWRSAAQMYQELAEQESKQRALARHRELTSSESDHAALEATLLIKEGEFKQADNLLSKLAQPPSSEDRNRILRLQVEALTSDNNLAGALERVKRAIETEPKNSALLVMGVEIALSAGNTQVAEAWEEKLRNLTNDGFDARFLRARRKLHTYAELEVKEKEELGRLITQLRTERPKWHPVIAIAAQYARLQGDWRRALFDYNLAIDLGDRRYGTLQQIVALLYKRGRFEEAEKYLSYLPVTRSSDEFFDTMAIELAMRQGHTAAALETARKSVERFPEDPLRRIALAKVLIRYGNSQEGLEVLRTAAREFPNDSRVWLGLFSAYVQSGKPDEARRTLAELVKSSVLPQDQRYFVAAQAYELLGDIEGARKLYQSAIEQNPKDTVVRLRFAKLLGRTDPKTARAQYEHVLAHESANGEARRELAILLAATGQETDWTQAAQLLATTNGSSGSDARTNDRLRAMLLARKGRTRAERISNCQAATEILRRLIEIDTAETSDLNRLLIAQVLEQEANLSGDRSLLFSARDHLRAIANRAPTAQTLSLYIEFLLRHGAAEALNSRADSSPQESNSLTADEKDAFLAEAEARLNEFQQLRSGGGLEMEVVSVAYEARLLQARGRDKEAKQRIDDCVAKLSEQSLNENAKAQRYLVIGKLYTSVGAHADAENWYRQLMKLLPNGYVPLVQSLLAQDKRKEAIELCLEISDGKPTAEMATLLANVMTAPGKPLDDIPQARTAIETAIKENGRNVELLHAEAVRQASLGQYDVAISTFRRVLEIDPENALALNNFATVLAERPNQRGEALELIQRAIDLAGRKAALLDTHGTILLKIGDAKQAIASLEEATAGGAADARYYLHLAAAYQQAQRYEDAERMLLESRAFGLDKFVLTDDDRELLARLEEKLSSVLPTDTP